MSFEYFQCLICHKYFENLCKVQIHSQTHTESQQTGIPVQALTFLDCQVVLQRYKQVDVPGKLQPTSNGSESVNLLLEVEPLEKRLVRKCRLKKSKINYETDSDEELEVKNTRRPSRKRLTLSGKLPSTDSRKNDMEKCSDPEKTKLCPIQFCAQPCANYYRLLAHLNRHCKAERKENIMVSGKQSELGKGEYKDAFYVTKIFHCKVCMTKNPSFKDLQNHLKTSHSKDTLKCPYCQENFGISALNLISHMRAIHPDKIYPFEERKKADKCKCDKCPYTAPNKSKLARHNKLMHEKIRKAPTTDSFLKKCQEDESYKKRRWPCPVCPARFERKSSLQGHFTTHLESAKTEHVCDYSWCGQKYASRKGLLRHIKVAHVGKVSGNRNGLFRQSLNLARQTHSTKNSQVHKVQPQLNTRTKTEVIDEIHLFDKIILKEDGEAVHLKGEYLTPIPPEITDDFLLVEQKTKETATDKRKDLENKNAALLAVLNDPFIPAEDPIFLKIAEKDVSARLIIQNRKAKVTPERKFKCSDCDKVCMRAWHLQSHMKKVHKKSINEELLPSDKVLLMCSKCAYRAKGKTDLDKHMKIHKSRGQKSLIKDDSKKTPKCGICGDTFTKPENLRRHIDRLHLGTTNHNKKYKEVQKASNDKSVLPVCEGDVNGDMSVLGM